MQTHAMTPDQSACSEGVSAFDALAGVLVRHDAAGTVSAARFWSNALGVIAGSPGLSAAVVSAIGNLAAVTGYVAAVAEEAETATPWSAVMLPAEQRLDAAFRALQAAC